VEAARFRAGWGEKEEHMRRSIVLLFPVALLAIATLVAGEDRKEKTSADKPAAKEGSKGKVTKPAPFFDTEEFIKEYDTNKDGALSKEEFPQRFRQVFEKLDTNKDGKISKDELDKGFQYLQSQRRPSDFLFVLVEMSDCDECCAEELQLIYDTIRKMDKNNDGKIDADELKAGREAIVQKRVDSILKELDTNKDGKISKDEARGAVRRHFAELDVDKDGFVSRDELVKGATELPGHLKKGTLKKDSSEKSPTKRPSDK